MTFRGDGGINQVGGKKGTTSAPKKVLRKTLKPV